MSDQEKAGLHGPVRTCVEEAILPDNGKHLTTWEYSPDGKILIFTARFGNSDGTEWITTHTYDATGRLTKAVSGNSREPGVESVYMGRANRDSRFPAGRAAQREPAQADLLLRFWK
jgi:hypothetical protein